MPEPHSGDRGFKSHPMSGLPDIGIRSAQVA